MNPDIALRAHVADWLRGDPALAGLAAVHAHPPRRSVPPDLTVALVSSAEWGAKDRRGRELRLLLAARASGEAPEEAGHIAEAVEARLASLPPGLPGWRIAGFAFQRGRVLREGETAWRAELDYRARLLADPA